MLSVKSKFTAKKNKLKLPSAPQSSKAKVKNRKVRATLPVPLGWGLFIA